MRKGGFIIEIITFYNSKCKKRGFSIYAETITGKSHHFGKNTLHIAVFQNFDYTMAEKELLKHGRKIGSKPQYFSLKGFDRIRFDMREKSVKVQNLHVILYEKNTVLDEPETLVISYNIKENFMDKTIKFLKI